MALVIKDRVRETTSTNGTGTIALTGAVLGYDSFLDIGDGNTTYYCIANPGTVEWEVGVGTYVLSGTSLTRDTVLSSSNSNALVNFSSGVKDVFCTYPAGKSVYLDSAGLVTAASGLGAGIPAFLATPTSANLAAAVTNETGSGALVFATSPTLTTPNLGTPSTLVGTNITGTAAGLSIGGNAATATTATTATNQSGGTVNATTGAFSGALTSTSTIQTNAGYVASGVGSGATALTTNDGYGNANLTFNHINGTPDVTGSSARITSPVDGSAAAMDFQLASNTTSGVALPLATVMTLVPTQVSTQVPLSVTGNASATSFSGAGTGLTGTASGLSIGGSAATLTTARTLTIGATGKTFNGSANVAWSLAEIGAQAAGNYVTTDTTQTITGAKTFSTVANFTGSGNQLLLKNATLSDPTVIHRADGANYYILLSAAGTTPNGTFNTLRPFSINQTTGRITSSNGQTFDGGTVISVNTTSDALRITQVGTGNAFVVEDSANPDSSPFVIDANGNVGIGTSAPTDKLQINTQDGVRLGASGSVSYARIGSATTGESTAEVSYERSTGSMLFSQGLTGSALSERMRINNVGNVGIGITPTEKLHVSGNILATGSIDCGTQFLGLAADTATAPSFSFTGDTNTGIFQPAADQIGVTTGGTLRFTVNTTQITSTLPIRGQNGSAAAPAFSASGDTNTGIYFPAADTIGFAEGGADVMRITSAGDVGIGTITPASKLNVVGTVTATSFTGSGAGITNVSLTTGVTGTLPIANGGTAATTAAGARTSLDAQETLVSGTNIKTVNGTSLLGSGDVVISGVPDGDKGDITVSASGATWTIDNGAVTPAKLSTGAPNWNTDGNVGLDGATPSAWGSTYSVLEYEQGVFFGRQATNNVALIGTNLYYDGTNWRYKQAAASGLVTMSQLGLLTFFNAPSGAAGAISPLAAQFQVNAVGDLLFNSGYGSAAVAYGCRAWVNFNGTGTVAIRDSGNVSSITDGGTGTYTVNFTTAMPDINYAIAGNCFSASANEQILIPAGTATYLAGSCRVQTRGGGGSLNDSALVLVSVFR